MLAEFDYDGAADVDLGIILHESEGLIPVTSQEWQEVATEDRLVLVPIYMAWDISHLQSSAGSKSVPYHKRSVIEVATAENLMFFTKMSSIITRFIGTIKSKFPLVTQKIILGKTS